jgi:uncharacterized protein with NRDE domain
MCLVVVAYAAAARFPLIIAANRDELHSRAARPAGWWPESPRLLGGRDLVAGGTWLGVDPRGRVAAVTNVRDGTGHEAPRSRGALVTDFLGGDEPAASFAARLADAGTQFAAYNLLLFDGSGFHYASNRAPSARLAPGVHAFSNAPRGVEWPKTASAASGVMPLLSVVDPLDALFDLLAARSTVGSTEERYRSAHFVTGPLYGTRCSTVILVDERGTLTFAERSFDARGTRVGEVRETLALAPRA